MKKVKPITEWDLMDKSLLLETDYAVPKITMNTVHKKSKNEFDQEDFIEKSLARQQEEEGEND